MLNLRQLKHLTRTLNTSQELVTNVCDSIDDYYQTLILNDPAKPNKKREVVNVTGELRRLQSNLYSRILLKKLKPSIYTHGGIRGRSIKTNAEAHLSSSYIFKTDISNFYPSIRYSRIYEMFLKDFNCSPDVARVCTRICTYKHHLALGLITSPILADQLISNIDKRIGTACLKAGLVYTRFVDDISISGHFNLYQSGFENIVTDILCSQGFNINQTKNEFSQLGKKTSITGIRILNNKKLDVKKEYADELERQLKDAKSLANNQTFEGPYFTEGQIRGRVEFVRWINPHRGKYLIKIFKLIPWDRVVKVASDRNLVALKKTLRKKDEIPA
ncbi:reverse transcriptase family protein [Gimesia sp.]|uniref:reverse transcriptase family protein n=1 Tax=Gimesia sp. TaxID=2024833 RepID=UPI003A8E2BF3